ncbi:MAG: hypothetical protein U0R44_05340 [Candidatus Micrarchaeia archaeon]
MISKEEILRRGYVDVKVNVQGLRQQHRMEVIREKTSAGIVPFLISKYYIPTMELVRLAEELQLPVKHKDVIVFPKGKMAGSFAEKKSVVATVESDTIEAEVES